MSGVRISTIVLACLLLWAVAASAGDRNVQVELTGFDATPSSSDGSTWGWWNPDKFDDWRPVEDSEIVLGDARMLVVGDVYTVILGGEWAPELTGTGTFDDPDTGEPVTEDLTLEISAYDLALGQTFEIADVSLMPWVGVTYLRISEDRVSTAAGGPAADRDEARTTMWGAAIGADVRVPIRGRIEVVGRLLARWARGTREADLAATDPGGGATGSATLSDSVDRAMWGVDLGLRWAASPVVAVDGGYRLRDWSFDDGPGSYSGPYLRAVIGF